MELQDFLLKLFRAHGIDAKLDGEWVLLPKPYMRVQAAVVKELPHPETLIVQLDVRIFIMFGRLVIESFSGMGATREIAVANALQRFVGGSFHVIVGTFFAGCEDQISREEWSIGGITRSVIVGGAQLMGTGEEPRMSDAVWMKEFQAKISRLNLSAGMHWMRLYYAQNAGTIMECEVLLDNHICEDIQNEMRLIVWPKSSGFYSLRLFLMIRAELEVGELAGHLCELRAMDDDLLVVELTRRGIPARQAESAVALIPLAFGRVMLKPMGLRFPEEADVADKQGIARRTIKLHDEPIFREATALAQEAYSCGTMTREEFGALALRSCEVNLVNQVLNAGSRLEHLVISPPLLLMGSDEYDAGATTATRLESHEQTEPKRKPWWRFGK